MREYLGALLAPLCERLRVGISIFDSRGECVFCPDPKPPRLIKVVGEYTINTEAVYFNFAVAKETFTAAMTGIESEAEVERLVVLLSALLEKRALGTELGQEDKLRALLNGQADMPLIYELEQKLGKKAYHVFAISCGKKYTNEVAEFLTQLVLEDDRLVRMEAGLFCLLKKRDNTDDYQSANEFAVLLNESITQELGKQVVIGIGGIAQTVSSIALIYSQAVSAFRLGKLSDTTGNIYSYKELVMLKMIEDIPREKLSSYLNILADQNTLELLADEEMMATAKEFLSNSLNISETSRLMYMHRNTLIYRLDKIEKATGLNIRNFSDAVTFRMILILFRLLNSK